jgi:hypothetical protein
MRIVNTNEITEVSWSSPKGTFSGFGKEVSEALGRKPESTDLRERHPFDVEIARIAPGATPCAYHSHSAQWEFYHVISGRVDDLILCVVADNPLGESNYYPDSDKWAVRSPDYRCIRSEPIEYFDGEE